MEKALKRLKVSEWSKSKRDNIAGYAFIGPSLIGFLVFMVYPIFASFGISLTKWSMTGSSKFIGLDNYIRLFKDSTFLISMVNTLKWVVAYVPVSIAVSLLLALALNKPLKGIIVYRGIFYLPVITPLLVVSLLFVWLYNEDFGLINYILSLFNINKVGWLTDPSISIFSIALMSIWKSAGWNMLILLAGLQGIPKHLYEAAEIDGITGWKKLKYITIPLLSPSIYYVVIMAVINAFQVFSEVYIMTSGGPGYSTYTMAYYLWLNAFSYNDMGYACAISVIMFILILAVTIVQSKVLGEKVQYDL